MNDEISKILQSYNLPNKFLVKFALYCANDVRHLLKDPESIKALEVTELWLEGKATIEEVTDAADNAVYAKAAANAAAYTASYATADAANAAAYAINAAAYAAYAAANATNASSIAAAYAANAAYAAAYAAARTPPTATYKKYQDKLLEMINDLSELERIMIKKY